MAEFDPQFKEITVDAEEKRLTDAYNKAVDELKRIQRGDPAHIKANVKIIAARRALAKYRNRKSG